MTNNQDQWRSLEDYLREEGPPPAGLADRLRRPELEAQSVPPELDARVLAQIRAEVGSDPIPGKTAPANREMTRYFIRAAGAVLFAGCVAWLGLRGWTRMNALNVTPLAALGPVTVDGRAFEIPELPGIGSASPDSVTGLTPGADVRLESGALLYMQYAPGIVVRVIGPARFATTADGIALQNGQATLLADAAASQNGYERVHSRFRLRTARADYRLLGTCLQIRAMGGGESETNSESSSPSNDLERDRGQDQLLVLEGAVSVEVDGERAATVGEGEGLRLLPNTGGDFAPPRIFALQEYDREALESARESLARYIAVGDGHNAGAAPATLSVEELRVLYGSVMRFQLRDGRSLVGFMIQTPRGDFIHTVEGQVSVNPADVQSFVLIE